ncbi:hypothetical protein D3C85_1495150 [compost metagenome]
MLLALAGQEASGGSLAFELAVLIVEVAGGQREAGLQFVQRRAGPGCRLDVHQQQAAHVGGALFAEIARAPVAAAAMAEQDDVFGLLLASQFQGRGDTLSDAQGVAFAGGLQRLVGLQARRVGA